MSIITHNDLNLLFKQLSINNIIINDYYCGLVVCKNNKIHDIISATRNGYLTLYDDTYLDYCDKNNNNVIVIENFIKDKKIKLELHPNIYKSNIKIFDIVSMLCINNCKYFTNIVNSKIERLCIDILKNNKNIKGINLLKKLNIISEMNGVKLNKNINIMNQVNKLNKYYKIIKNIDICMIYYC